ncbi:hypothetical protein K7I13_07615 [Brucepastera parasyntrophica]|uniref:hypothetical protein n=1 Tax=Brucepastera parasyntrophica TaxID=2880008 RepID=UPI002108973C|nr:hypothetical protein [Brucepastera parasyntrophica]ULQ58450.1 hypothetical protein K7I13_07615 [Brucepastera parasyntrophica]
MTVLVSSAVDSEKNGEDFMRPFFRNDLSAINRVIYDRHAIRLDEEQFIKDFTSDSSDITFPH